MAFLDIYNIFKKKKKEAPEKKPVSRLGGAGEVKVEEKVEKEIAAEKPAEKLAGKKGRGKAKKIVSKEDTGQAYRILIKPLVTEKATNLGAQSKYIFMVASGANKIEIKKAIENVYGVEPIRVNIMHREGRNVRYGRSFGKTKAWKKALVTLKQGDKIQIYEGV